MLPERVEIRVSGLKVNEGVGVMLRFKMARKCDYSYLTFLDASGRSVVVKSDYLADFKRDSDLATMDYIDPVTSFTGEIHGQICGKEMIEKAIKAYEFYKKYTTYPAGRDRQLKTALGVAPEEGGIKVIITTPSGRAAS